MITKETKNKIVLVFAVVSIISYIVWRTFFTLPFRFGLFSLILGILLLVSEMVSAFESIFDYYSMTQRTECELPIIDDSQYPHVDVLIATHNEEQGLLYKTINACLHMDYPDKNKVHIYLCDDTNRCEIKKLAQHLNIGYLGLEGNTDAKAGNLNHALSKTQSPLVVTFDADMIPRREFLMKTVPYFELHKMTKENNVWVMRDESDYDASIMGFVQAPQAFYNPDLFQYNLYKKQYVANEQDYFFQVLNPSRNGFNAAMYVGSNTVLRREALEQAGGFTTGTLTEDFATGIEIQKAGYSCIALDEPMVHGLNPVKFSALIKQRQRWARGCIQTIRKTKPFSSKALSIQQKLVFLCSYIYWFAFVRQFIFILIPLLTILCGARPLDASLFHTIVFWLPAYVCSNYAIKRLSSDINNVHTKNLIMSTLFPFISSAFIAEQFGFKQRSFVVTDKGDGLGKPKSLRYGLIQIVLFALSIYALYLCIVRSFVSGTLHQPLVMFWLLVMSKNLLFSILIIHGRPVDKSYNALNVSLPVQFNFEGGMLMGETNQLFDNGFRFSTNQAYWFPDEQDIECTISTDLYQSSFKVRIIEVENSDETWMYHAQIKQVDECELQRYFQIMYDRALVQMYEEGDMYQILDDLFLNLSMHIRQALRSNLSMHDEKDEKLEQEAYLGMDIDWN